MLNKHLVWRRDYDRKRYAYKMALLKKALGGVCIKCGADADLELDHVDPNNKVFTISTFVDHVSDLVLKSEIVKCQLMCKSCHRIKSIRERGHVPLSEQVHGTPSMYRHGRCRCLTCKEANNKRHREYKLKTGRVKYIRGSPGILLHGSSNAYGYHGCRCVICKEGTRLRGQKRRAHLLALARVSPRLPKALKE